MLPFSQTGNHMASWGLLQQWQFLPGNHSWLPKYMLNQQNESIPGEPEAYIHIWKLQAGQGCFQGGCKAAHVSENGTRCGFLKAQPALLDQAADSAAAEPWWFP